MKNKYLYIVDKKYMNRGVMHNPILFNDEKLEKYYPELLELNYDVKLLVTKDERQWFRKNHPDMNEYQEKYGNEDISIFDKTIKKSLCKNVFLNGFHLEHLEYIAPLIKDNCEVLYLFKCPKINDLKVLKEFSKLKVLYIFWNNTLETLPVFNETLEVISFNFVTKLKDVSNLVSTNIKYINIDSRDSIGNRKELLIEDITVFDRIKSLEHLKLEFKKYKVDY